MKSNKKLSEKASKLDFTNLPALAPVEKGQAMSDASFTGEAYKPKTAPGAMMAFAVDARSELIRENERLKASLQDVALLQGQVSELASELSQWDGAKATKFIDPKRIKRSRWANRHDHSYSDPEFFLLKEEILNAGGNVQPIKIRYVGRDEEGDFYEIVFGHRRHQACLDLELPVLSTIDNLSDQGLFIEMDRENRSRKNLAPWEQGMMYLKALNEGLFPSQRKLAEAVGIDLSALGKALNLARLPAEIINAFPSPLEIQFRWAKPLTDALVNDEEGIFTRAASLSKNKETMNARSVFEFLVTGYALNEKIASDTSETTLLDSQGKEVGLVNIFPDGAVNVQLKSGVLSKDHISNLLEIVKKFLKSTKIKN